jgi:hypothetical protein
MKLGIRQSFFAFPLAALLMVGFVAKSSRNPTLLIQSDPSSYLHFAEQLHQESPSGNQTVAVQASLLGASLAMQEGDQSLTASCLIAAADFAGSTDRVMMWDLAVMIDPSRMEAWRSHRDPQESYSHATAGKMCRTEHSHLVQCVQPLLRLLSGQDMTLGR